MRHVVLQHIRRAVCLLAFLSVAAAANQPDFSGEWKMNAGKSAFGPIPAPTSLIRTIAHSDPSLTIAEEQKGGSEDHVSTRRYTTDGKQSTFQENGAVVNATATWDGGSLVIRSVHIETPQGGLDATYSFDKQ